MILAAVLWRALPTLPAREPIPYGRLLGSVFAAVRRDRAVPVTPIFGATSFSVFTLFWTSLTFLLSAPPFSYSVRGIGLIGLAGLAGALAAQRGGRFHAAGHSVAVTGGALALAGVGS